MIKLSVIIPVYNGEKYLKQCLDSLINQTLKDVEIICINDGSVDNSLVIIHEYQVKYPFIKVINQSNQGQGIARNNGLARALGEYIHFLDADDCLINETILEGLYNNAKSLNVDILMFNYIKFYEKYNIQKLSNIKLEETVYTSKSHKEKILSMNSVGIPWNKIYKKDFLIKEKIAFAKGILYEDTLFFFQAIILANSIGFNSLKAVLYRKHTGSSMKNTHRNKDIIEIYSLIYDFLVEKKQQHIFLQVMLYKGLKAIIGHFKKTSWRYKKEFFLKKVEFIEKIKSSEVNLNDVLSNKKQLQAFVNSNNFYICLLRFGLF